MPDKPPPDTHKPAQPVQQIKPSPRKALEEQRKRELPTNDWPGKGAA